MLTAIYSMMDDGDSIPLEQMQETCTFASGLCFVSQHQSLPADARMLRGNEGPFDSSAFGKLCYQLRSES